MKHVLAFFLVGLALVVGRPAAAQSDVVQFSGYVLTPDTLMGIPFVNVYIPRSKKGTISREDGYFSFAAEKGDTVRFSCLGFEPDTYVIPADLQSNKYTIIKLLTTDTFYLNETVIYPWPSRETFRMAFLNLEMEEDDVDRALKALEAEYARERGEMMAMDADENADYYLRQEAAKYYWAGQAPPQNIFNVFAWAQFIEAWKRGDFKRKKNRRD